MANQDTSFTLKVKVSPELGIGFVQLFVGDDKYIISSVEFDEGVTTERGQEVIIVAVSSRGNEFASWDGQTTWLEEGDTGDLRGVVKGDLELTVDFGKITQKDGRTMEKRKKDASGMKRWRKENYWGQEKSKVTKMRWRCTRREAIEGENRDTTQMGQRFID